MTGSATSYPQRVLVVGGSRGIGRATVLQLARLGAHVALVYQQNDAAAEATAKEAELLGRCPVLIRADISTDAESIVASTVSELGGLDLAVVTAVPFLLGRAMDAESTALRRAMDVVVGGFQQLAVHAAATLSECQGSLIAVSSLGSWHYASYYGALGPTKAALESLVRYLAAELGPRGVRVNAISPCLIDNPEHFADAQEVLKFAEPVAKRTPLRRLATPDDVAAVIAALGSDAFGFVTGQTIAVDGGYSVLA